MAGRQQGGARMPDLSSSISFVDRLIENKSSYIRNIKGYMSELEESIKAAEEERAKLICVRSALMVKQLSTPGGEMI